MNRLNVCDDEEYTNQAALWHANCDRSLAGKKGQAALKRLRTALLTLESKRLIRKDISRIEENRIEVCALGAVAMMEDREEILHGDGDPEDAGIALGFPRLVAWTIVAQNDIQLDYKLVPCEGPAPANYHYGRHTVRPAHVELTPEERYEKMLEWVKSKILVDSAT